MDRRAVDARDEVGDPDASLVERARKGDRDAFGELVRRHQRGALRLAVGLCGSTDEAQDVVQEGFVKAYQALDRFRAEASFRPWVMTIVANEARNRRRSTIRRAALAERAADRGLTVAAADSADPVVLTMTAMELAGVVQAVNRLGEADRSVIACRYFAQLSEAETAVVLGCRPGTVKSRTSRALVRLRDELTTGEGSW